MKSNLFIIFIVFCIIFISCGGDESNIEGGLNEDCYPNNTCDEGLLCINGKCYSEGSDNDTGTLFNDCYSNNTCDEGLICFNGKCYTDEGSDNNPNPVCGNNKVETGEVCDGGTTSCNSLSKQYSSGNALCRSDCSGYDESLCNNKWRIQINNISLTQRKPDGTSWDVPGGMPDVFVIIYKNEEEIFITDVVDDSLYPSWSNAYVDVSIDSTDRYDFWIYDEDIAEHDPIADLIVDQEIVTIFNIGNINETFYNDLETTRGIISFSFTITKR